MGMLQDACFGLEHQNHADIATVETASALKFLFCGAMNFNFNTRFEQFDITEGGLEFDLVKDVESKLPTLDDDGSGREVYKATKLDRPADPLNVQVYLGTRMLTVCTGRPGDLRLCGAG